jgi:hypothetical protein
MGIYRWAAILLFVFSSAASQADDFVLPQFEVFSQPDGISCGPTAGVMVLRYYDIIAGIGPMKTKAKTRMYEDGRISVGLTHPANLRDAIESYGLNAHWYKGVSTNDLVTYINQGRPPIVLLRSGKKTWHYVALVGYRDNGNAFYVADPGGATLWWMSAAHLQQAWQYSGDLSGNYIADDKCGNCHGSGNVWTECPTCGGSGWIKDPLGVSKNKCPFCSGQGKWSANCPQCSGKGHTGDAYRKVVESSGASGNSVIVPLRSSAKLPGNKQALTCIYNTTDVPISFDYRWGDDAAWSTKKVEAGKISSHWFNYEFTNLNRSPNFYVRFDFDMSSKQDLKSYNVRRYATESRDCSKLRFRETFKYSTLNNREVDLFHSEN